MKKTITFFVLTVTVSVFAFAQSNDTLKSKRGYVILPQTDEWGLGVSAQPFLQYVGNMFNFNGNSTPSFNYTTSPANAGVAIFGKKMIDANTAYRARFNFSSSSNTNRRVIAQDQLTPDPNNPRYVDDRQKIKSTQLIISAGIEKRRGHSRVQGVYGVEGVIGFSSGKTIYEYGNNFSQDFPNPTTTNFGSNISGGVRTTEEKFGMSFLIGARGFAGIEYFVAPKISLGGEFGYLLSFRTTGKTHITAESWNGNSTQISNTQNSNNGLSYLGIGLDNLSASINLLFYF